MVTKIKYEIKHLLLLSILILVVNFETIVARGGRGSSHSSSHHSSSHSSGHSSSHSSSHSSGHSSSYSPSHYSSSSHSSYGWSSSPSHSSSTSHSSYGGSSSPSHYNYGWTSSASHNSGTTHSSPDTSHTSSSNHDLSAHSNSGLLKHSISHSNNQYHPSASSSSMDSSHRKTIIAATNHHPELPAGGTFHRTATTLPTGAVYYAQPPVYASKPSFESGLTLGVLSHSSHNTVIHSVPRYYHSSSTNSESNTGSTTETSTEPTQSKNLNQTLLETTQSKESNQTVLLLSPSEDLTKAIHGIICLPMNVTTSDPNDGTKAIEVEQIACYPAPPPTNAQNDLEEQRMSELSTSLCFSSDENVVLRMFCHSILTFLKIKYY